MTEYQKAIEAGRIQNVLKLWEIPGFLRFIDDLATMKGEECHLRSDIEALKRIYKAKIEELQPETKFIQTKLDL